MKSAPQSCLGIGIPVIAALCAGSAGAGETPVFTAHPVPPRAAFFALDDVRLLDGPLQRQQELNRQYLLRLDPDRLLSWFRREAGLEPKAPPYRGWESEGRPLPGHILGFYMTGAAMTVQATGDGPLRQRLGYIVDQLAEIQKANKSGYMLAVENGKRVFAEIAEGRIEIDGLPWNGYQINGHFEPTYTMNKLMLGLVAIHQATGNDKAKEVFLRLADWFGAEVIDKLDERRLQTLMQCEHGSLHESFADAYTLSGDAKYLAWSRRLCHERMLTPLADKQRDFITHFHANSNIPKYTGFERIYQETGEPRLHAAAVNFWEEVVERRSWVIGGNSSAEHFFSPDEFATALNAPAGPESCNSVNMLRLTEALFQTDPSAARMDFYERVLFNHILAAHDPERAMCCYYTTMKPGGYRVYSDEFDSMWCCTGTGLEVPGKYARMIFSRSPDDSALDVNLFAGATLQWKKQQVTVSQTTGFPYEEATTLNIRCERPDARFTLRVRHPWWVPEGKLAITLNGQPLETHSKPGTYAELKRDWHNGDTVRVALPMSLSAEALPGDDRHVALLNGPIVLSGELGRSDGLRKEDFWGINTTVATKPLPESKQPVLVADTAADVAARVRPLPGKPMRFTTGDLLERGEISLIPFFENHFQRYVVYWPRLSQKDAAALRTQRDHEAKTLAELNARTVDRVVIGNVESERSHGLKGELTESGPGAYGRETQLNWRDARSGGWFSFDLAPANDQPQFLRCTYWGRERGERTFDVLIDGNTLETRTLADAGKDDFIHADLPLPESVLRGKRKITVKFQAHPGNSAGGLFDLRVIRAGK